MFYLCKHILVHAHLLFLFSLCFSNHNDAIPDCNNKNEAIRWLIFIRNAATLILSQLIRRNDVDSTLFTFHLKLLQNWLKFYSGSFELPNVQICRADKTEFFLAELWRAKRACGVPRVSKSTHPRKFSNHVTVHRPQPALFNLTLSS